MDATIRCATMNCYLERFVTVLYIQADLVNLAQAAEQQWFFTQHSHLTHIWNWFCVFVCFLFSWFFFSIMLIWWFDSTIDHHLKLNCGHRYLVYDQKQLKGIAKIIGLRTWNRPKQYKDASINRNQIEHLNREKYSKSIFRVGIVLCWQG